jgi:ligand-binding sensor domain-containing protein/serine phosphatase RsbU (regulator of sigma subunit)
LVTSSHLASHLGGRTTATFSNSASFVIKLLAFLLFWLFTSCQHATIPMDMPAPLQPQSSAPFPVPAYHQRYDNDIKFTTLSLDQGLSQSVVNAIWQDHQGFMWFGTQDGLNRFDGYTFKVYKNNPNNPHSLSNNYVYALAEDAHGDLWVGTSHGLNRFDLASETFTVFIHDPSDANTISSNIITELVITPDGALWIGTTGGGVNRLDPQSLSIQHFTNDPADPGSLSHDSILSLLAVSNGDLWVGTLGGGLNYLDVAQGRFTRYQHDPDNPNSLIDDIVNTISQDEAGQLWLGTTNGLSVYNPSRADFTSYQINPADPDSLNDNLVLTLFHDRSGVLWVGTNQNGLNRMYPQTGQFVQYTRVPDDPHSLPAVGVASIYQDRGGVLWFGTFGGGISHYSWAGEKFQHIRPVAGNDQGLNDGNIWGFLEDSQGNLWIGTAAGGVNRIDAQTGRYTYFINDPNNPHSLSSNFVFNIHEDSQGRLWFGTFSGGLNRLDPATGHFIHYPNPLHVFDIIEEPSGQMWIATENGLGYYEPEHDRFTFYTHDPADPDSISDNLVTKVFQDRQGDIWVGTFGNGLNLLNPQNGKFIHYQHDPNNPDSLVDNLVLSFCEDHQGRFWIGTTGGLDSLDRATGIFTHFLEQDGLPNNTIYGILEDQSGYLWLSTNRGLSRFDPESGEFRNFTTADGLQSNEFNQYASYQDRQGRLFFGGLNGYNVFKPDDIIDNPYLPPVVITQFELFNEPINPGDGAPLQASINFTEQIQLTHQQDFFTFVFSALDYTAPERNQYAYRLNAFDEDWNYVGNRRIASYTNVPPGVYTFEVRGTNSDGLWNETGATLQLIVKPPFWQTWWFRILTLALVIGSISTAVSLRIKMIEKQKLQLEELVEQRTSQLQETLVELQNAKEIAETANRRYERELNLAGRMQVNFLPHTMPDLPGWQIAARLIPSRETSGDFYDIITLPEGQLGILIADVVDKGAAAALFMALCRSLIRIYLCDERSQPAQVFERVNYRLIQDTLSSEFVTVFLGILDTRDGRLVYANAGHCPGLHANHQPAGTLTRLKNTGMPLGIEQDASWKDLSVHLADGDLLLLYTDGITEAQNTTGEFFEETRLQGLVQRCHHCSATEILQQVLVELNDFTGQEHFEDDVALVILKRSPQPF